MTLFTNYPRWAVARFGVGRDIRVRGLWPHGVALRALTRLWAVWRPALPLLEPWLHIWFGRWAATQLRRESWDVVHVYSGVAEESCRALAGTNTLRMVARFSSHIRTQARLLQEEEQRTGARLDRPSAWMIAREEREYALADMIMTNSSFARDTLLAEGVPAEKAVCLLFDARYDHFGASSAGVEARCQRILAGEPLRVLNVGAFSLRKGMWDAAAAVEALQGGRFVFRFVGPLAPEAAPLAERLRPRVEFVPKQAQHELPQHYDWGDVFWLPTVEDGFPAVLSQAASNGLPILTTPNGAGKDVVREGQTGWLAPIRSPAALVERLRWCDGHRVELAAMVRRIHEHRTPRAWADVARDFERICAPGALRDLRADRPREALPPLDRGGAAPAAGEWTSRQGATMNQVEPR